jgi:hypothetical protein
MRKAQFTKTLTVALSPELYRKIKEITDAKQVSISEWFRDVTQSNLNGINNKEIQNDDKFLHTR